MQFNKVYVFSFSMLFFSSVLLFSITSLIRTIKADDDQTSIEPRWPPPPQFCNETFTDFNGTISSPNETSIAQCFYHLEVPPNFRLELQLSDLWLENGTVTECDSSFLKLQIGTERKLCGFWTPDKVARNGYLQSASSAVDIEFFSVEEDNSFKLSWTSVESCSDSKIEANNGTITSPNFPGKYLNSQNCTTIIRVTDGMIVELQLTKFQLEPLNHVTTYCVDDWLEIDGSKICSSWVGRESKLLFYSKTNVMRLTFVSNEQITGNGFIGDFR